MSYEGTGLGAEVFAASPVGSKITGTWLARQITPAGERGPGFQTQRSYAKPIGAGDGAAFPRSSLYTQKIGPQGAYGPLRPFGPTGMGMSEVRAASGVPTGVPGNWWAREITPEGEVRDSETPASRNWSHTVGGGPLHKDARFWSHPIGRPTDYPYPLTPMGTDDESAPGVTTRVGVAPPPPGPSRDLNTPGRVVSNAIQSATGSHTAGEMAAGYLSVAVPFFKQRNPYLFLFPTALALATGGVQYIRGKSLANMGVAAGIAYLAGPIVFYGVFLGAAISGLLGPVT
jgi:hypothetical protein